MTEALEDEITYESSDVEGNLEPIVDCGEFYFELLGEWEGISGGRCLAFTFYIEDEVSVLDTRLVVKISSEGYVTSQHTSGVHVHSRQSSSNDRTVMGEMLLHKSVCKIYNKQFNNAGRNESFTYGNLTYLKSQDCMRKIKSEIKSTDRFSNSYMEDIAATQQYFLYLLQDTQNPSYVQYFVQNSFLLRIRRKKSIS